MTKRQKYTQEFRESANKLTMEQRYPITEAVRNLGINATMMGRWKRKFESGVDGSPVSANGKTIQAEPGAE